MDPEGIYGGKEDAGLPPKAPLREPSQPVNVVNGIGHGVLLAPDGDPRDCGPMPECLIRRPALGPPGDSLDDLQ